MTYKRNINALQMLRACAALLIVVWHSHLSIKYTIADYWTEGDAMYRAAHYPAFLNHLSIGVDIFFCISGFIMNMLIHKLPPNIESSLTFFANRLIRIIPPYWFFSLLVVFAYFVSAGRFNVGGFTGDGYLDCSRFFRSILFVPQSQLPVLPVGWTLIYEFQFYLLCAFAVLIRLNGRLPEILFTIAVVAVVLSILNITLQYGYALNTFYIEFFFGALIYRLGDRITGLFPILQVLMGIICYLLLSHILDSGLLPKGISGVISNLGGSLVGFFLISGLIGVDQKYSISECFFAKILMRIGDASYTLYLAHWFVLSFMGKLIGLVPAVPVAIVAAWQVLSIAVAVMFSVFLAERVELPFHRKLLDSFKRRRRSTI